MARYYTPNHRSIQERGITPDVLVEAPDRHLPAPKRPKRGVARRAPRPDPQLDRAVDLLRGRQGLPGTGPGSPLSAARKRSG